MSKIGKLLIAHSVDGITLIEQLVDLVGPEGAEAHAVLEIIKLVTVAIREGHEKKIDPAEVTKRIEAALAKLQTSIADNRQAALDEVDDKFPAAPATAPTVDAKFPPGE